MPTEKLPNIKIDYNNESPIPFNSMQHAEKGFKWINQQKFKNLETATLMISPISSSNNYYKNNYNCYLSNVIFFSYFMVQIIILNILKYDV